MTTYDYGQVNKKLTAALMSILCEPDELLEQLFDLLKHKTDEQVVDFMRYALERHVEFNTLQSRTVVAEATGMIMSDISHSYSDAIDWALPLRELLSEDPIEEDIPSGPLFVVEEALCRARRLYGKPTSTAAAKDVLRFAEAAKHMKER